MSKLGFYTQNFALVAEPIRRLKPPVLLAEMRDRGALRLTRNSWSPDTFIIGRFHFEHQRDMLYNNPNRDPAQAGHQLAETFIRDDSFFPLERGTNGRFIVDAWMTLNELLPGPASANWQNQAERAGIIRDAEAYDTFQEAFLKRLRQEGLEAVAFNFAAGNWTRGEDYIQFFPKTLNAYTYLGFHEYGWPLMNPDEAGASSACGIYRQVMEVIRERYGPNKHKAIITEAGLARMYRHNQDPPGDVGWLYQDPHSHQQEVTEADYKDSLRWYNQHLEQDDYVLGACLFMVGVGSDKWETFEHVGSPHNQPLTLITELETLAPLPVAAALPGLAALAAFDSPVLHAAELPRRLKLQNPLLEGEDVHEVQAQLAALNYLSLLQVNGVFNETTHLAVREFQITNHLIIDGIVGSQTWQALFSPGAMARPQPPKFGHLKVGLDLNSPLNAATGEPWGPVTQPAILADTCAHWTRLNFILGPEHQPNASWFGTYRQLIQQLNNAWNGSKPHLYALVSSEAAHRDPRNLLRFPPVDVDWAWRGYSNEERQKSVPFVHNLINQMGETPEHWIERYAEHFGLIVAEFQGQIHYFETFNEPNDWHLGASPEDQVDPLLGRKWERPWVHPYWVAVMLERIHQHTQDIPDVKIIASPLLGFGANWEVTEKYLRDVYQAGQRLFGWDRGSYPFYGVGYHLYIHPSYTADQGDMAAYIQRTYREHLNRIHRVIKDREGPASDKKIYISEFGWPCPNPNSEADQAVQAHALQTAFELLKNDPRVDMAIWFCTVDFTGEPFGLFKGEPVGPATQKKALEAFRAAASVSF